MKADYGTTMREHLAHVEEHNAHVLDQLSKELVDVIARDGLIYVAATGHSIALMLETFYRAGGLANVQPLYHPALLPLHGGTDSTLLERVSGFAHILVERYDPTSNDIAFIFSNSGINAVPVEIAKELRARGTPIVGVVSMTHLRQAPMRADKKLDELADHILDTLVPYGDAAYPLADGGTTAGLSTLSGVFLWNLLLSMVADRSAAEGIRLPVWTSANVAGGSERTAELRESYRKRVPLL